MKKFLLLIPIVLMFALIGGLVGSLIGKAMICAIIAGLIPIAWAVIFCSVLLFMANVLK